MKSRVVFMALLCLLLIFTGAYAADKDPVAYENLVYNGSPQVLVNTEGTSRENFTKVYCRFSGETAYSQCADVTGTNASTYNVEYMWSNQAEPPASTTFNPTGTISVIIKQSELTVAWDGDEFTYDDDYHPSVTVKDGDGNEIPQVIDGPSGPIVNFKLNSRQKNANTETEPTYTASFEITNANYVLADGQESEKQFTIKPANVTVTTEPEVVEGSLTFNDKKQNLLKTKGAAEGGTITYVIDDEYKSEISATARIPGTHTVKYFITPDENHTTTITEESPNTVGSVEIKKLPVTVKIEGNSAEKVYSGNEESVTGYQVKEINSELYNGNLVALAEGKEAKAAGIDVSGSPYAMGLKADSFVNKNETCYDVTFDVTDGELTITKAEITDADITVPTLVSGPLSYNGGKQPLIATAGSVEGGEMVYILDKDASNYEYKKAEDVKAAIPMTHTVHYYIVPDDNHTTEITKENPAEVGTVVIEKLKVTVTIKGVSETKTYNGEEQSVTGVEVTNISNPLYPVENVVFVEGKEAKAAGTDVKDGGYPMGLTKEYFATLQDTLFDVTFEIEEDGKLTIEKLPVTVTITGNSESKVYNGEEQSVEGFTFTADSKLFKEEDFTLADGVEAKAKGTDVQEESYKMNLKAESFEPAVDSNFDPTFNVTDGELTITPLEGIKVAIEGKKASVTYDGKTHNLSSYMTPVTITLNGEPTELYKEGDDYFTRDNTCGKAATGKIDAGSYPLELKPECFTNVNSNFTDVAFEVTDGELTITPLDVTVTITGTKDELTYTGEELSVEGYTATATSELFNVEEDFGLADGKEAAAKGTNVQEEPYMMGLSADSFVSLNDNFNPTFEVTDGSLTIKENAGVVVTIAGRQVTVAYTGEERVLSSYEEPVITLDGEPTTLYTTADFTRDKSCGIARGTDVAGSPYKMNLTDACFTNTNSNFENVKFVVTDGQFNIIPLEVEVTITGNSEEKVYNGEEQSVEGYTFEADSELFTEEDFGLADGKEAKASGTNVQDEPYPMGLDAEKFVSKNGNFEPIFTIAEDGSLTITPLSGINVAIEGKKASVPYDGKTHNLSSYKTPVITLNGEATTLYTADDFTRDNKCGKDATKKIDAGTYPLGLSAKCFENTSLNFANVAFEVTDGELTITPLSGIVVSIEGNKGSVTYDGKEHNISKYQTPVITLNGETTDLYTTDDFTQDETCGKAATGKTEVGTYPMELTAACFTNTNSNFEGVAFEVTDGALTIKPKPVTITAGSTKKYVYDGTALTNSEFTVKPEVDHEFTVTMTEDSTVTDASKAGVPNVIATVDGVEVTTEEPTVIGNFTVTTVDGVLQVSRREVTITAADAEQVYNGSALTSEDFTWTELPETDDHVFAVTMTENSTITNVGTQPNTIATVDEKEVTPGSASVVGNYLVTIADGELKVTPKAVTITAADGEWVYDGHTHRQPEFTTSDLEEGDDHVFEVEMTADSKVTRATTKPNVIATVDGVAVTTGEETEVGNYLVTTVDGALTVTEKGGVVVTITGNNASVTYDGKEHTAFKYDKVPVEITLDGQPTDLYTEADFERDAACGKVSATNAGIYPMGLYDACFTNKNGNFSDVSFVVIDGALTIKPAEVTLSWNSAQSFLYTGKVHGPSAESITIEGLAEGEDQTKVATITVTNSPMTDADPYTAKAEVTFDPANYVLAKGAQTEFPYIIHKATITVDPAPVLKEGPLPYTGSYQALLESLGGLTCNNNADPCPGSIIYVLNGQWETNPDENPSAVAVGEYTVSYYVTDYDTNNYQCEATKESPANIDGTVEIAAADVVLTWMVDDEAQTGTEKEISYDGKDHTIGFKAVTGSADVSDKMVLSIKKDGAASDNPAKDSGVYTAVVSVTPEEAVNFRLDEAQTTFTLTINKIEAEISFGSENTHVYDGTEWLPEIIVKETASGNTVTDPALETKVTAVESELGYPNVGKYKLTVTNKDPNMAADPAEVKFEITKADYVDNSPASDVTEPNSFAVTPVNTTYNGEYQPLAEIAKNQSTWGSSEILFAVVDENGELVQKAAPAVEDLTLPLPMGLNVGTYELYYRVIGDANHNDYPADGSIAGPLTAVINPADLADAVITLNPSTLAYTGQSVTANPTVTFNNKLLVLGEDYEISGNVETEEGTYTLVITAVEGSNFTGTNSLVWRIRDNAPQKVEMFRVGQPEEVCLRCGVLGGELPATGFPTRVNVPLAVKPEGLNYTNLNMRIQIPTLNVDVELAGVPTMDGAWKVEWLEDRAGLLSGTALPGDGYSIVAAHNTLNAEETGPFVLLSTMQNNDTIFVNAPDGSLRLFRVYANELLAPNDMEKLASIAEQESNTLVLVTCENESVDGGYLNRRVVFAKPLN